MSLRQLVVCSVFCFGWQCSGSYVYWLGGAGWFLVFGAIVQKPLNSADNYDHCDYYYYYWYSPMANGEIDRFALLTCISTVVIQPSYTVMMLLT